MAATTATKKVFKDVLDLKAKRAARKEAEGAPIVLTYGDDSFEIPHTGSWPIEVNDAISVGDTKSALILLMGVESWNRLHEITGGLEVGDVNDIFTYIAEESGLGEAEAR